MLRRVLRQLLLPMIALGVLLVYGTVTFSFYEGLDWFDSLYWTVTVLSMVGFGDITPSTQGGKIVFMSLAFFGLALYGYIISSITSFIAGERLIGVLSEVLVLRRRRVGLEDHVIIIYWNRLSHYIYGQLKTNDVKSVVVVKSEEVGRELSDEGITVVVGSYTREETLIKAGIDKARAVILAQEDASERLISLLKVRKLSKDVDVIVVSHEEEMEDVFLQAGATKVANISDIGGRDEASYVFEPNVAETLLDLAEAETGLDLTEHRIPDKLDGRSLSDLRRMGMRGAVVLVKRGDHKYYYPDDSFTVKGGDVLILLGLKEDVASSSKLFTT